MPDLDDDAVVVTLPPDDDGTVTKIVESEKKAAPPDPDDPIESLKGQFANMTQRATAAEMALQQETRKRTDTERELQTTKTAVADGELSTVLSGIQAAESDAASAEKDYIAAAEAGDFPAQARAQRKMASAEARKLTLEQAKGDLEDQKTRQPVQRTETRQEPRQAQQDPVEAAASAMAPRAASWVRAHPECITDKSKNAKMMATHYAALADGLEEGGNDYFARLDAMVAGAVTKVEPKTEPKPSQQGDGRRPISAAASGANAGGGMNGGGTEVRLTAREVAAATDGSVIHNMPDPTGKNRWKVGDPIGVQIFAQRKLAMQKEGRYDKSYTES